MSKPLIVMALPQESRGLLERAGAQVLYTGVGKVNAAAALARRLAELRCAGDAAAAGRQPGNGRQPHGRRTHAGRLQSLRSARHGRQRHGLRARVSRLSTTTPAVIEFPIVFTICRRALFDGGLLRHASARGRVATWSTWKPSPSRACAWASASPSPARNTLPTAPTAIRRHIGRRRSMPRRAASRRLYAVAGRSA